jgi:hypothetical protein
MREWNIVFLGQDVATAENVEQPTARLFHGVQALACRFKVGLNYSLTLVVTQTSQGYSVSIKRLKPPNFDVFLEKIWACIQVLGIDVHLPAKEGENLGQTPKKRWHNIARGER